MRIARTSCCVETFDAFRSAAFHRAGASQAR